MDVHVRDLRYFLTLAEELSFTRAAARLFVAQPTLSNQIRVLEQQLGTALFLRDRRSTRTTAAGAALLPRPRRRGTDLALAWLPVPGREDVFPCRVLVTEPRWVALPAGHRLDMVPFDALLDEPFLALPDSAGDLRSHWLAEEQRGGPPGSE